ncbi:sulfurtransferase TusA family protein [candidate division WOR-3 bacterium]|nr:sulfurtransferase TusA family protein [candidate division WOR-3 bacterium]
MDEITVDARGLSCPQPVLDTLKAIDCYKSGFIEVLVDTATSRDNVRRAAEKKGFKVEIAEETERDIFKLKLSR